MYSFFKMIVWGIAWFFVGSAALFLRKKKQDNCLTWGMRKMDNEGGYLAIRWCRSNRFSWMKWPHFLWLEEKHHIHLQHFVPDNNEHSEKLIPTPWFDGHIKQGDDEDDDMEN